METPTVNQFKMLQTTKKAGNDPFICPDLYTPNDNTFVHRFKNGVSAIVVKCSMTTYSEWSSNDYNHPDIGSFQTWLDNEDYYFIIQYSNDFKGFIAIFFNNEFKW